MRTVAPNIIDVTSFTQGYMPDTPPADVPEDGLLDVLNLVPDRSTGALRLRNGFKRVGAANPLSADGFTPHFLWYFEVIYAAARHKYLIYILNNGTDNKFVVYDIAADTHTVKKTWSAKTNPGYEHWGTAIQGTWYGGSGGIAMYSWNPETDVFNDDAAALTALSWSDDVNGAVNTATEYGRDHAFKKGQRVAYSGDFYTAAVNNHFEDWVPGDQFTRGQKVTHTADWESGGSFYEKSFECIKGHDDSDGGIDAEPGVGADWRTYWKRLRLKPIINAAGDNTTDWYFLPTAPHSIIGAFHGDRLWLRRHDDDNWSWLQYTAPLKPERNTDLADLVFDPTSWDAAPDKDGGGGGWMPFEQEGDAIRALVSLGTYLVVFKRWSTHVVAGRDEATWNRRVLDPTRGTIHQKSTTVIDGLLYFMGMDGNIYLTDGTRIEPAEGTEKVRLWMKDRLETMLDTDDGQNWLPVLTNFMGYIFITMSGPATTPRTVIYHPETGSFWPTDLPALDFAVGRIEGSAKLWFSEAQATGTSNSPQIFQYQEDQTTAWFQDLAVGDDAATETPIPITWRARSHWFDFGTTRVDRRIRRTWALVKSAVASTVTIRGYRQYNDTENYSLARTTAVDTEHLEGQWMPDARTISLRASGSATAAVYFYGFGCDTQPRRLRYHTGGN